MTALILAAGYGTRMKAISERTPKPLLPVGERVVIDYLFDQLGKIEQVRRTLLVTNSRFHGQFIAWAKDRGLTKLQVLNDGTCSNEERLGAIGDLQFAIETARVDDDLLVAGADNIFRFEIQLLVDFFLERKADVIAVVEERNASRLGQTSTLRMDQDGRVLAFAEKAPTPLSNLICPPLYIFRHDTLPLVSEYLNAGNSPDAPGHFIAWLHKRRAVYGKLMPEGRLDIGTPETYRQAQGEFDS